MLQKMTYGIKIEVFLRFKLTILDEVVDKSYLKNFQLKFLLKPISITLIVLKISCF